MNGRVEACHLKVDPKDWVVQWLMVPGRGSVIQRLIEHCLVEQLEPILAEITDEIEDLAKDE